MSITLTKKQMYWQTRGKFLKKERIRKLRLKVRELLGGKCMKCERVEQLQLHHLYYAEDSVIPKSHNENGNQTRKRDLEALKHPERFQLLCLSCHNKIHRKFMTGKRKVRQKCK